MLVRVPIHFWPWGLAVNYADLAALLGLQQAEERPPELVGGLVSLSSIIVFPQPRVTFVGIRELAVAIQTRGLLNPLTIAQYTTAQFRRHVEVINECWGTEIDWRAEVPTRLGPNRSRRRYNVLLAGERRYRAIKKLVSSSNGQAPLFGGGVPVRVCVDATPMDALAVQFVENIHTQPPPAEEARALANLLRIVHVAQPDFSLAAFSRMVGRSESTVRGALRFSNLPASIQKHVVVPVPPWRTQLPYGIAVELARLQEAGLTERELLDKIRVLMALGTNVSAFRASVSREIGFEESRQGTLALGITSHNEAMSRRYVVARKMVRGLWGFLSYFQTVTHLLHDGLLGKEESPYSLASPLKMLLALTEQLKRLVPHLRDLMPEERRRDVAKTTLWVEAEVVALLAAIPDEGEEDGNGEESP